MRSQQQNQRKIFRKKMKLPNPIRNLKRKLRKNNRQRKIKKLRRKQRTVKMESLKKIQK